MSDDNSLTGSATPETTPDLAATDKPEATVEVEETTAESSAPEKAEDESDAKDEKPKQPKSRARERIEQLSRDNRNLRRSLSRAHQRIGEQRAERLPRAEEFVDPAQYQTAIATRAAKAASLETQADSLSNELGELQQKRLSAWNDIVQDAKKAMPDFETVFHPQVPVSEAMAEAIMETENPDLVAYWLGKNVHDAARISQMTPYEVIREITRIDARVSAPAARTVSSAPRPVQTVSGKSHKAGKSPEEMSYDEYKAWRSSQKRA